MVKKKYAYTKLNCNIFKTPFQKIKYRSLGVQSADGNCAMGNLNPLSLININCSTWVASSGSSGLPV